MSFYFTLAFFILSPFFNVFNSIFSNRGRAITIMNLRKLLNKFSSRSYQPGDNYFTNLFPFVTGNQLYFAWENNACKFYYTSFIYFIIHLLNLIIGTFE